MLVRAILEPGNRFAFLAVEWWLGCGESCRLFQVLVEPIPSRFVLLFFVRIELSAVLEIPYSMKNSEPHLRVGVDLSHNKP